MDLFFFAERSHALGNYVNFQATNPSFGNPLDTRRKTNECAGTIVWEPAKAEISASCVFAIPEWAQSVPPHCIDSSVEVRYSSFICAVVIICVMYIIYIYV